MRTQAKTEQELRRPTCTYLDFSSKKHLGKEYYYCYPPELGACPSYVKEDSGSGPIDPKFEVLTARPPRLYGDQNKGV